MKLLIIGLLSLLHTQIDAWENYNNSLGAYEITAKTHSRKTILDQNEKVKRTYLDDSTSTVGTHDNLQFASNGVDTGGKNPEYAFELSKDKDGNFSIKRLKWHPLHQPNYRLLPKTAGLIGLYLDYEIWYSTMITQPAYKLLNQYSDANGLLHVIYDYQSRHNNPIKGGEVVLDPKVHFMIVHANFIRQGAYGDKRPSMVTIDNKYSTNEHIESRHYVFNTWFGSEHIIQDELTTYTWRNYKPENDKLAKISGYGIPEPMRPETPRTYVLWILGVILVILLVIWYKRRK